MVRPYQYYTREEDELILRHMRDVNKKKHREVLARCTEIAEIYLPARTPEGIRERWFALIGKKLPGSRWRVKDVADLLSPEQKARIRLRPPTPRSLVRRVR